MRPSNPFKGTSKRRSMAPLTRKPYKFNHSRKLTLNSEHLPHIDDATSHAEFNRLTQRNHNNSVVLKTSILNRIIDILVDNNDQQQRHQTCDVLGRETMKATENQFLNLRSQPNPILTNRRKSLSFQTRGRSESNELDKHFYGWQQTNASLSPVKRGGIWSLPIAGKSGKDFELTFYTPKNKRVSLI